MVKKIVLYETSDGERFSRLVDAEEHAAEKYNKALKVLAAKVCRRESPADVEQLLEDEHEALADLVRLRRDLVLTD